MNSLHLYTTFQDTQSALHTVGVGVCICACACVISHQYQGLNLISSQFLLTDPKGSIMKTEGASLAAVECHSS